MVDNWRGTLDLAAGLELLQCIPGITYGCIGCNLTNNSVNLEAFADVQMG